MMLKCAYCGCEFLKATDRGRPPKYCSSECRMEADKANKRTQYIGKRENVCRFCGTKLPKFKTKFCSNDCKNKWNRIQKGVVQSYEPIEKVCICCGKTFYTYKQSVNSCSAECVKAHRKERKNERQRAKYLKNHPNARTLDEIIAESKIKKIEKEKETAKRKEERTKKLEQIRLQKKKEKAEKADYWLNYSAVHTCVICGESFDAKWPTTKYCSDKCKRRAYKRKDRYKGITIDKDITLEGVATRDDQKCKLCGCIVDWNDYEIIDGVVICGNNYPSIDHIVPISLGGMHSWKNVQLAHRGCNTRKSNKKIG